MDLVDVFRVETQRAAVTRSGVRHQLNQHRADGRTHYELLKGGILRVCGGVNVCHPTWSFTMTHGGGCMSGSPPSSPLPPQLHPGAKRSLWSSASSAWLSAWYQWIILRRWAAASLLNGSSFAPLTAAAAAAAARWQNVFSPLRLIELKVLHIHCCCFWTAVSSEESISLRVFALHHRALTGHSAFRAEQKGLMGLVLSDATPAQSGSPSPPSASYGGKQ